MIRRSFLREASAVVLVLTLLGGWLVAPAGAHNSPNLVHNWNKHYKRLARKIFYTKRQSNLRFVNVGETATNAALLDGMSSGAFAAASHAHSGADITSGTVDEAVIDVLVARVADVLDIVLADDGAGSGLDADLLDGMSSGAFAAASHAHGGADITSGTIDEARIDALIARVADVFDIVLTADGSGSTLDADLLDGQTSNAFADASHVHSGDDITSGTVGAARIDAAIARDGEVFGVVTAADGSGSTLDADLLDGQSSNAFANASHVHSGDDITSGSVDESVIDALIARVADVFDIVLAADGAGSTLDADLLDGMSSGAFATASHVHSGADITSGTVAETRIDSLIARVADVFGIVLAADGSGSTLDADLLDGQSSNAFALAGETHTASWFKEAADSLATTATSERVVFTAPENVTITDVIVEPAAAVTASDTNYATITVSRRDSNGSNQVTVVSETTQTAGSGGSGSWTAFSGVSLGSLSNTALTAGQKVTIAITKSGVGVSLPILSVHIEYTVG